MGDPVIIQIVGNVSLRGQRVPGEDSRIVRVHVSGSCPLQKSSVAILLIAAIYLSAGSLALATETSPLAAMLSGRVEIIDGDTLRLGPVTVRIHGIDAPEADQHCAGANGKPWHCGRAATDRIAELTEERDLDCTPTDRDHYVGSSRSAAPAVAISAKRSSARVSPEPSCAMPPITPAPKMKPAHRARYLAGPYRTRLGFPGRPVGARRGTGAPVRLSDQGHISRDGERIHHTPWSPAYGRTKIDEAKGSGGSATRPKPSPPAGAPRAGGRGCGRRPRPDRFNLSSTPADYSGVHGTDEPSFDGFCRGQPGRLRQADLPAAREDDRRRGRITCGMAVLTRGS